MRRSEPAKTNWKSKIGREKKIKANILRHKDGNAQRMSMSCLFRINISNAAMYIYDVASHRVIYSERTTQPWMA